MDGSAVAARFRIVYGSSSLSAVLTPTAPAKLAAAIPQKRRSLPISSEESGDFGICEWVDLPQPVA
jgi:hypothetical protein